MYVSKTGNQDVSPKRRQNPKSLFKKKSSFIRNRKGVLTRKLSKLSKHTNSTINEVKRKSHRVVMMLRNSTK